MCIISGMNHIHLEYIHVTSTDIVVPIIITTVKHIRIRACKCIHVLLATTKVTIQ